MDILDVANQILNRAIFWRSIFILLIFVIFLVSPLAMRYKITERENAFTKLTLLKRQLDAFVLFFAVCMFLFVPLISDIIGLLQYRENYLGAADCLVLRKGTTFFNRRGIFCDDGSVFIYSDYLKQYETEQAARYKLGNLYHVKYLPATRIIVSEN